MTGHEEQLRRLAIADARRLRPLFGAGLSPGDI